jgi:acyl-CoA hydrolase
LSAQSIRAGKADVKQREQPDGKVAGASCVSIAQLMQPEHANPLGNVHGGTIMKLADEAGGLAAMRHAGHPTVTVFIDSMTFYKPVQVGALLHLHAQVSWVGHTSVEVLVTVEAENPLNGERVETNSAFFVYVALDDNGRPTPIPRLICATEQERERMAAGEKRQRHRLSLRQS